MNKKIITFDVGTNFDYEIINYIKENDTDHRIKTLYGKLKNDGLPGGRASTVVADFTHDDLEKYVAECKKAGLSFNYLMNPLCMGQRELDPKEARSLRENLHKIYDLGIREFTVNSPLMLKYLKNEFSDVSVTLGLYAYPVSLQQIQTWVNWGADEITLDHSFNRNFKLLEKTLRIYKDTNVSLRVIANNLCLKECPFRVAHGSFTSHSDMTGFVMDYYLINCAYRKISNPNLIMTGEWIRPDDLHFYEDLCEKTGNKKFSFKLVDRTRSTDFILTVVKAYLDGRYDGNLVDILNLPQPKNMKFINDRQNLKVKNMEYMNPAIMPLYGQVMTFPTINIDNRKLDGYFDHFVNNYNCTENFCSDSLMECSSDGATTCGYCKSWAEKAISYDEAELNEWREKAERLLNIMQEGSFALTEPMPFKGMPPQMPGGMPPMGGPGMPPMGGPGMPPMGGPGMPPMGGPGMPPMGGPGMPPMGGPGMPPMGGPGMPPMGAPGMPQQ